MLTSKIWDKETNSLFDYETTEHIVSKLEINKSCHVMKANNKLYKIGENVQKDKMNNCEFVSKIKAHEDYYEIEIANENSEKPKEEVVEDEKPWMIIRYTFPSDSNGYRIKEGDYLKFGKIIFKAREIKIQETQKPFIETNRNRDRTMNLHNDNTDINHNNNYNLEGGTTNIFRRGLNPSVVPINRLSEVPPDDNRLNTDENVLTNNNNVNNHILNTNSISNPDIQTLGTTPLLLKNKKYNKIIYF